MAPDLARVPQGVPCVRVLAPDGPVGQVAFDVEIDGHLLHPTTLDIHFEHGCWPVVTLSLVAHVENAEALVTARTGAVEAPEGLAGDDEPPQGCLEEC